VISKILVPLDGSQAAEAVLPYVERIAITTNARIACSLPSTGPGTGARMPAATSKASVTRRSHTFVLFRLDLLPRPATTSSVRWSHPSQPRPSSQPPRGSSRT
jgi:hypothetical protein